MTILPFPSALRPGLYAALGRRGRACAMWIMALGVAGSCDDARAEDGPASRPVAQAGGGRRAPTNRVRRLDVIRRLGRPADFPAEIIQALEETSDDTASSTYTAGVLPDSTEARNWIRRAAEGLEAEDFKLAVDALQRLVEIGGDAVVSLDGKVYVLARRRGHQLIAELPPAGLRTYRLLYDPEAKKLYERGLRVHDESALVTLISRLLLTSYGDDACDLLAAWYLDTGRAAEAASVLIDLLTLYPDSDLPPSLVRGKLALAYALLDEPESARQVLEKVTTDKLVDPAPVRLAALSDLVRRIAPTGSGERGDWPMLSGGPARLGRMEHAAPDTLRETPQVRSIPMHEDAKFIRFEAEKTWRLPVYHAVSDGEQILIKTDARLVALDSISLKILWQSVMLSKQSTSGVPLIRVIGQPAGIRNRGVMIGQHNRRTETKPVALFNDIVGGVTLVGGLALVVDRPAPTAADANEDDDPWQRGARVVQINAARQNIMGAGKGGIGNQVLAFSLAATTGDPNEARNSRYATERMPAWIAGNTGEADDPLAGVEFLAPPISVGAHLLIPYRRNADLHVAVLDPADGSLVRSVYLCRIGTGGIDVRAAQHVAFADQIVYVPTGQGILVAISVADYSIRWVSRYRRIDVVPGNLVRRMRLGGRLNRPNLLRDDAWLSSPPVVVGPVVVLAPSDGNRLFAFDRRSGRIVWDVPRGKHRYIVGVTRAEVDGRPCTLLLLGGESLTAMDIVDASQVWTVVLGMPTGRGALVAGAEEEHDLVFMPTDHGVAVVDAITGEVLERTNVSLDASDANRTEAASGAGRLGNLLSWGGSLISVDAGMVRQFRNVDRAFALASEAHQRNPRDPSVLVRLVSLELLRGNPGAALELAEGSSDPRSPTSHSSSVADRLGQLRVEALLALARRSETDPADVAGLLRRAFDAARTPEDRFATSIALARHRCESGDRVGAIRQYLQLCLSPLGPMLLSPVDPESNPGALGAGVSNGNAWRCRGWRIVARELPSLHRQLLPDELEKVTGELMSRLEAALAEGDPATVRVFADVGFVPAVSQRANLALARQAHESEMPQNEQAEFFLQRASGRGLDTTLQPDPALAAEALARRVVMDIAENQLPIAGMNHLDALESRYGGLTLPADLLARDGAKATDRIAVSSFVAEWRERVPAAVRQARKTTTAPFAASPTSTPTGVLDLVGAWPIRFQGHRPEVLNHAAMFLVDSRENLAYVTRRAPGVVQCHVGDDLTRLWPAELVFAHDWIATRETQEVRAQLDRVVRFNQTHQRGITQTPAPAIALADGQTMIVTSSRGVHAIGLTSGLRLWARALPERHRYSPGSDHPIALADPDTAPGHVAMILSPTTLEVATTLDGSTIWQREIPDGELARIEIQSNAVVAVSLNSRQVWVYDLFDGRLLTTLRFDGVTGDQPHGSTVNRPAAGPMVFDTVICGLHDQGVTAYALRTGERRWSLRVTEGNIRHLFMPNEELLGVGSDSGELVMMDPSDGNVRLDVTIEGSNVIVEDAVLHGDVVVVQGRITSSRKDAATLFFISVNDGLLLKQRRLAGGRSLNPAQLRAADNAIPVLELVFQETPQGRQKVAVGMRVTLIDKSTGQDIGRGTVLPANLGVVLDGAIEVGPGRIIVGGRAGAVVFPTQPNRQ